MKVERIIPWPLILTLLLGVIIPTACVIWFMSEAVQNERLAVKQKLSELYISQLTTIKQSMIERWHSHIKELDNSLKVNSKIKVNKINAQIIFSNSVSSNKVSSLIIFSDRQPVYPSDTFSAEYTKKPQLFLEAQNLEFRHQHLAHAIEIYKQVQNFSKNPTWQAEAIVAQARCLSKLNKNEQAIQLLNDSFIDEKYATVRYNNGRLIRANAIFHTIQLLIETREKTGQKGLFWESRFTQNLEILESIVTNYDIEMPTSQRRFLFSQLIQLPQITHTSRPTKNSAPSEFSDIRSGSNIQALYRAEKLAIEYLENGNNISTNTTNTLVETADTNLWRTGSIDEGYIALFEDDLVQNIFINHISNLKMPDGFKISLSTGGKSAPNGKVFATISVDELAPGWKLEMYSTSNSTFEEAANRQIKLYIWTGIFITFAIFVLTAVTSVYVSRQIRSSRLKNDLIATVSHELKTPLASMRLLVDTLINSERAYDSTTSEYLHLVSKENARLTQLIDNFLTFSRMERNKAPFNFEYESANEIAQSALDAIKDKFKESGFSLNYAFLTTDLYVLADKEMLVTALINLLENAYKYSTNNKEITFTPEFCHLV